MNDDDVLDFVDGSDDALIAARVRSSYQSMPEATSEQIERCRVAVLAGAREASRFGPGRRWWVGAAAAAALLAAVTLRPGRLADGGRGSVNSATADAILPSGSTTIVDGGSAIRFDLQLPPETRQVALVGDFNGWDSRATPMVKRQADGTWTAKVRVVPGVHNYAFVIDGVRWMVDPLAPQVPDAGFGPANAVVVVGSR